MPDSRFVPSRWIPKNAYGANAKEALDEVRRNTVQRIVGAIEAEFGVPPGTLEVPQTVITSLAKMQPDEVRHALIAYLASDQFDMDSPWMRSIH